MQLARLSPIAGPMASSGRYWLTADFFGRNTTVYNGLEV